MLLDLRLFIDFDGLIVGDVDHPSAPVDAGITIAKVHGVGVEAIGIALQLGFGTEDVEVEMIGDLLDFFHNFRGLI